VILKIINVLLACLVAVLMPVLGAIASNISALNKAPDSTQSGPHQVASAEYRFPAATDPDILSDRMTEIWAKMTYPKDIGSVSSKAPLIIMLHGNHSTCGTGSNPRNDNSCEYTNSGTCPTGYVPVPSHAGYDYLAENLASWGFIVASINANRGINCGGGSAEDSGLNLARGKLVLAHLSLLYKWTTVGGAPASLGLGSRGLLGKVDFANVGLLGHSRGGEGVRAAYNLYLDSSSIWLSRIPGLSIKAIYEIGAVDGQTSRVLDANGTVWNQLLPMCDGDVSDLEGRYPFERMLLNSSDAPNTQKSLYEVWGANHNFFNTEWQSSDASGCLVGTPIFDQSGSYSAEQKKIALASIPAFFRSHLGSNNEPAFNQNFNPLHLLPDVVTDITQVDRDFTPTLQATEIAIVEDFDKDTGTNSSGNQNDSKQIDIQHQNLEIHRTQRVAAISWHTPSQETFFEAIWAGVRQGRDIHDFATLDFRIGRISQESNPDSATDFGLVLTDASGQISNDVHVSEYSNINGPGNDNPVLKTVRIPLSAFQGVDLTHVHSVRFIFDKSKSGALYLANIRVHRQMGLGKMDYADSIAAARLHTRLAGTPQPIVYVPASLNTIRNVRFVSKSLAISGRSAVEIHVASQVPFPAMDRLPVLGVGDKTFTLSHYSDLKELKELTFTLTYEQYRNISKTSKVTVSDGKVWLFGTIAQSLK